MGKLWPQRDAKVKDPLQQVLIGPDYRWAGTLAGPEHKFLLRAITVIVNGDLTEYTQVCSLLSLMSPMHILETKQLQQNVPHSHNTQRLLHVFCCSIN